MCYIVHNTKTGEEADSPKELAAMIGIDVGQLIIAEGYGGKIADPDSCLCQIDVRSTLKENGWKCRESTDPMDVEATPPDSANDKDHTTPTAPKP